MADAVIAVTGEGPTDYGHLIFDKKNGPQWEWGPVLDLLENCMKDYVIEGRPDFRQVRKEELKDVKLLRSDRGLKGLAVPARKFKKYCCGQKIERGIFYADADAKDGSAKTAPEAKKYYREVYQAAASGLEMGEEKTFIPMIPLKMIENWLLADEDAFEYVFGKKPKLPQKPELIWGDKRDPDSDYPKNLLERVLRDVSDDQNDSCRETFCRLAKAADVSVLRTKCKISFERFYQDFREMLQ